MEHETQHHTATFEKINATLDRIAERQEKAALEMEEMREQEERRQQQEERRQQQEEQRRKEVALEMKKTREEEKQRKKEVDKEMKELRGLFTSQWGKLMESLVEGDLIGLLTGCGIAVHSIHPRVYGRRNGTHYEFDIVAGNGDEVVVVEVKTTLKSEQVTEFLEKLQRFTVYEPLYRGKRIYGAVAYLKADSSVTLYAERQGLFVIRATGSSASIVNDDEFVPRVF